MSRMPRPRPRPTGINIAQAISQVPTKCIACGDTQVASNGQPCVCTRSKNIINEPVSDPEAMLKEQYYQLKAYVKALETRVAILEEFKHTLALLAMKG